MLPFRRALIAAAFFLTVLFLITRSHSADPPLQQAAAPKDAQTKGSSSGPPRPGNVRPATEPGPGATGQKPMMDISRLPLREQLAHEYPYTLASKFPAYIWQTWRTTPADKHFEYREQEASWTEQHPGFIHEVITDDIALALLRLFYASVPQVIEAYDALPLAVLKADFFRYLILFARGGIYSDIDTYALRSALDWIPATVPRESVGLVIGIEADPDREDWAEWYSRRIQFCQWTIQAKPGHPALRETIARITEETLRRKRNGALGAKSLGDNVIEFTGPALWTDVLFDYFNDRRFFNVQASASGGAAATASGAAPGAGGKLDWRNFTGMESPRKVGDVVVLPITGFSPGVKQMGAKELDDPMAMVKHDFEGTWKPEHERHIGEIFE